MSIISIDESSPLFSIIFGTFAPEIIENSEDIFHRYYMHSDVFPILNSYTIY